MKLGQWGEQGIINFLADQFKAPSPLVGIGDDCAVIPLNDEENLLVTVDTLTEGIHFLASIPPEDLGYKSVMVNVSDIASMGGVPEYIFLAYALPSHLDASWVQAFLKGFNEACKKTGVLLLGGDTVGSQNSIFISVTALGKAKKAHTKLRSQAKGGDIICVTGQLGESPVGLKCLLSSSTSKKTPEMDHLIKAHTRPEAHFKQGIWLGEQAAIHAMTDISDGIAQDLTNIIQASQGGAIINIDQLPISPLAKSMCILQNWDYETLALSGGEEYCLMLTVDPHAYPNINEEFKKRFNHPLYSIGRIIEGTDLKYYKNDQQVNMEHHTFNHFEEK